MKMLVFTCLVLLSATCWAQAESVADAAGAATEEPNHFNCNTTNVFPTTICYVPTCTDRIVRHIEDELTAAFAYMYIAAHFDDDRVARPGLAKFLYESASEERHHAIMMLDYLKMRGVPYTKEYTFNTNQVAALQKILQPPSYSLVLEAALKMEIEVTDSIYQVIESCGTDFHGADFLTDPILTEQHEGVRKLQGAIRSLQDLKLGNKNDKHGDALAEFIFDRKVLAGGF